jgi:hypothetical protein
LLAFVYTPFDSIPAGKRVWERNNLAQKNLVVAPAAPDDALAFPFQLDASIELTAVRLDTESQVVGSLHVQVSVTKKS